MVSGPRRTSGPTMHDVARVAGVSVKTVSNVVNGYPYIRPGTRQRVQDAITALGYRVNLTARSLRQGRSRIIGLAVPELSLPYFAELADTIMRVAERRGVMVLIEQTNASREREVGMLANPLRHLTDGLIFSPLALGQEDAALFEVDFPLVLLGERVFDAGSDHVTMDNVQAARAATAFLIERGHRRIVLLGAHPGEQVGSAALRTRGYATALAEAGIAWDEALVAPVDPWHRSTGAAAMTRLLDAGVAFDAVFGLNDAVSLGAIHALHGRGLRVPEDVAMIGFDDTEEASYAMPPLTSVAPGREQIAETAVRFLLERIDGTAPAEHRRVVTTFSIVERASTAG